MLKDFSTKDISSVLEKYGYIESKNSGFPTIKDFFKMSKIDLDGFYETCALMSIKTSNNQEIIDRMEYNKFHILSKNLNKYIEAEQKANGGGSSEQDEANKQVENMKSQSNSMMKNMKMNMPSMPKLK